MRYRAIALVFFALAGCIATKVETADDQKIFSSPGTKRELLSLQEFTERYEGQGTTSVTVWERQIFTIQNISTTDCDAQQIECHRDCMNQPPPWPRRLKGWEHNAYCRGKCLALYMECLGENAATETFASAAEAAAWLARHPEVAARTTFVVVAGATFLVMTDGMGLALLAF